MFTDEERALIADVLSGPLVACPHTATLTDREIKVCRFCVENRWGKFCLGKIADRFEPGVVRVEDLSECPVREGARRSPRKGGKR